MNSKVNLKTVFFKLKIEDIFILKGKSSVVCGRVESGTINNQSEVLIVNQEGMILSRTRIIDLDWFDRCRCGEYVEADEGMNIGILFDLSCSQILSVGNYIVIE